MSLLKIFDTVSSYSTAKEGKSISYPNISFVEEDSSVRYINKPGDGGSEFTVYDVGTEQNITCSFEDGMTWRQWVESDYNTLNLAVQGDFIVSVDNPTYLVLNVGDESEGYIQENVHPDDLIIATDKYVNRFMG